MTTTTQPTTCPTWCTREHGPAGTADEHGHVVTIGKVETDRGPVEVTIESFDDGAPGICIVVANSPRDDVDDFSASEAYQLADLLTTAARRLFAISGVEEIEAEAR